MIRYCIETIGYAPDDSDMRKLVHRFDETDHIAQDSF
jgi:hypothetical protein